MFPVDIAAAIVPTLVAADDDVDGGPFGLVAKVERRELHDVGIDGHRAAAAAQRHVGDADGILADDADLTGGVDRHLACIAVARSRGAKLRGDQGVGRLRCIGREIRNRDPGYGRNPGEVEGDAATAAIDALGDDRLCAFALDRDVARMIDGHVAASPAAAARQRAHDSRHCVRENERSRVGRRTDADGAVPPAATDRLGDDAVRALTGREDRAGVGDRNRPRVAAGTADTANGDSARAHGMAETARPTEDDAAIAAAATDRLRKDAVCIVARGLDRASVDHAHLAGVVPDAADRTDVEVDDEAVARAAECSEGDDGRTVAPAAADRLRHDAMGLVAFGHDDAAECVAGDRTVGHGYVAGLAAVAALSANVDIEPVGLGLAARAEFQVEDQAAIPAAPAERARRDPDRALPLGVDKPFVDDVDRGSRVAGTAFAADADFDRVGRLRPQ